MVAVLRLRVSRSCQIKPMARVSNVYGQGPLMAVLVGCQSGGWAMFKRMRDDPAIRRAVSPCRNIASGSPSRSPGMVR